MAEIYWQTLLITLIQQAISIAGITFNWAIVWITVRNKNLQNSYGYFLAIYSFGELVLESGTFLPTALVLFQTKIPLLYCFYESLPHTWLGALNASFNLLFISVDRLLAMLFPIFYRFVLKKRAGKFVIVMNSLSSAYIFVFIYFNYLYVLANGKNNVYCEPGDTLVGEMFSWALDNVIVLNIVTLSIYILLGILIRLKKDGGNQGGNVQRTRRIYKSLITIMGVIFFLYFMGFFGGRFIIPLLTSDSEMTFLYFRLSAQLITVAGAINAPVLYFLSTEYRNVLNQHFPFIRTFLVFFHIQKENANANANANANNVIQLAAATSTNPPPRANQSTQRQMPSINNIAPENANNNGR